MIQTAMYRSGLNILHFRSNKLERFTLVNIDKPARLAPSQVELLKVPQSKAWLWQKSVISLNQDVGEREGLYREVLLKGRKAEYLWPPCTN
jgi:hypothetical protein